MPWLALIVLLMMNGCYTVNRDKAFLKAIEAGDKTLIHSACHAGPTVGYDICKVREGRLIREKWVLIVPYDSRVEYGGIRIRWKDTIKTYPVKSPLVIIPFKDIIGETRWKKEHEAPLQAQVGLKVRDSNGETVWVDLLGYAFLIVLTESYHPLFIDSGNQFFETTCKIQYSTAGRSAITCK